MTYQQLRQKLLQHLSEDSFQKQLAASLINICEREHKTPEEALTLVNNVFKKVAVFQ